MLTWLLLAAAPLPIDAPLPGPKSPSAAWVVSALKAWTPATKGAGPLTLECRTVAAQPDAVAVRQTMAIAAPIEAVAAVVDDFAHYVDLYPDLAKTEKVKGSEDRNRFEVFSEQIIPVLPNIRLTMTWLVDRSVAGRIVYRYHLKEASGPLRFNDGFLVLEAIGPKETKFSEVDVIDAAAGPVPARTVWTLAVEGIYRTDVALKLKAEHPDWSYARIKAERERLLEANPQGGCYDRRAPL